LTKFSNNKALNKGGALFLDYQKIKVENTEFSNNEAQFGGAIYFLKQSNLYFDFEKLILLF